MFTRTQGLVCSICLLRRLTSNGCTEAVSTHSVRILVSKYLSAAKGTKAPERQTDLRTRAEKPQVTLEHILVPENKEMLINGWRHVKGHRGSA